MTTEKIAKIDLIVYYLKRRSNIGVDVRACKEGAIPKYASDSFFFEMKNPCKPPHIGERITVTVELDRYYEDTQDTLSDAVPEVTDSKRIPLPDTISYRFREQADADFGAGTVKSQEEYQRLDAKWQEEHQE